MRGEVEAAIQTPTYSHHQQFYPPDTEQLVHYIQMPPSHSEVQGG
jgi:hypothetical protein